MRFDKRVGKRTISWYCIFDLPPDPATGKRRQKRVSAPTKKKAEQKARDILHAADRGHYTADGRMLVRDYLPKWLENFGQGAWEKTTYWRAAGIVDNHLIPEIGDLQLERVTTGVLTDLYRRKLDSGLSTRTVRYIHSIARQAFGHAVTWRHILYNSAAEASPPKLVQKDMKVWNEADIERFLDAAHTSRYYPAFVLALLTGLRRGKLLSLRWSDVDLDRAELMVRQALKDDNGTLYFGPPKRHRSRRPIALSGDAVAVLRRHRAEQNRERLAAGAAWEDYDLVFATELGTPVQPSNFGRTFRAVVKRAGVTYIRPHDMRHTHATLLLTNGTHTKVVSERLGHASSAFTMDVYSHVLPDMQREAADQLDGLLRMPREDSA